MVIGLLVTRAGIDPFIASLGVGTFLFGVSYLVAPQQVVAQMPPELKALDGHRRQRLTRSRCHSSTWCSSAIGCGSCSSGYRSVATSTCSAPTSVHRSSSASPPSATSRSRSWSRAAHGIRRHRPGRQAGWRRRRSARTTCCLPSWRVLLGSTTIRPGRVNVLGTLVAVFVLAVAVAGLQQLGRPVLRGTHVQRHHAHRGCRTGGRGIAATRPHPGRG